MSNLKIRNVRAIITQPPGARTLIVVKVETNEPELHGLGCASIFLEAYRCGSSGG